MIYIASPYSNASDKELRAKTIKKYSANQFKFGHHVICPITLGLALASVEKLSNDSQWWISWCLDLLSRCDELHVLCFDGWETSSGLQAEIKFAKSRNIPITYITIKDHA